MKTPAAPVYTVPWWKSAVIYQIYPRSFCDSDNDGVGDLNGIREKLPYLVELGINAVWLSPIFLSPMKDFGYDVADYCAIDPVFGTMADFDKLVADAHDCGIRVMLDWVGNHTSDQSEWFTESRSSLDNAKREWYVWRGQNVACIEHRRHTIVRDHSGKDDSLGLSSLIQNAFDFATQTSSTNQKEPDTRIGRNERQIWR